MLRQLRPSRRGVLAFAAGLVAAPVLARPAPARVRLLRGAADPSGFLAGIEIALDAGWKTYWRVAGDSGIPPRFDFAGSRNLAAADVLYPAPARLSDGYGEILGYSEDVVFPVRVRPLSPDALVMLQIALDFGVCERLCIPMQARLDGVLSMASPPAAEATRVARALERVPRAGAPGSAVRELTFDPGERRLALLAALDADTVEHVIVEGAADRPLPLPRLEAAEGGRMRASLQVEGAVPAEVLVTVVGAARAAEERRSLAG